MPTDVLRGRRTLLRDALGIVGLGAVGLVLGNEGRANASTDVPGYYTCCKDPTCAGTSCGSGKTKYHCVPNQACAGGGFCGCYSGKPNCFTLGC